MEPSDKFQEMVGASRNAIEDFNDMADDRAIVWAAEQIERKNKLHDNGAKECPFCGNSWGAPQFERSVGGRYQFGCSNPRCGASAGWGDTELEALELWNTRT